MRRGAEVPPATVLRAVAKPGLMVMAVPDLTKASGGAAIFTGLFMGNPIWMVWAFLVFHPVAIYLTYRDRYCVEVWKAKFRCRKTRNLRVTQGHRYVA